MIRTLAFLAFVVAGPMGASASFVYAVNGDKGLYRIDISTAAATKVVTLAEEAFGLHIWGTGQGAQPGAVFVTTSGGELRELPDLTSGALGGVVYTLGGGSAVNFIDFGTDPVDGDALVGWVESADPGFVVCPLAGGPIKIKRPKMTNIRAFATADSVFYSVESVDGNEVIWKSTFEDNSKQELGRLTGMDGTLVGMAYDGSTFFGLDTNGNLYTLDLLGTQKATKIGATGLKDWRDMSFGTPVPEPATLCVLAALSLVAIRRRRA